MLGHGIHPQLGPEITRASILVVNECAACGSRPEGGTCWWCGAGLCAACSLRLGHCGHPAARAIGVRLLSEWSGVTLAEVRAVLPFVKKVD
jgi:hypothetical protein